MTTDKNGHLKVSLDTSARLQALHVAFQVLVKMQSEQFQHEFVTLFKKEVSVLCDLAMATANPDKWIASFANHADRLVALLGEK